MFKFSNLVEQYFFPSSSSSSLEQTLPTSYLSIYLHLKIIVFFRILNQQIAHTHTHTHMIHSMMMTLISSSFDQTKIRCFFRTEKKNQNEKFIRNIHSNRTYIGKISQFYLKFYTCLPSLSSHNYHSNIAKMESGIRICFRIFSNEKTFPIVSPFFFL